MITAKGTHVTIDLNGTRIIDRDDPKFDKEGIIALQIHVGRPDGSPIQGHRDQGTDPLTVVPIAFKAMPPCRDGDRVVWVRSGLANNMNCAVIRAVRGRPVST